MRIIGRSALCVAAALALNGFLFEQARADAIYSVTNLGPAPPATSGLYSSAYGFVINPPLYPNGNYLGAPEPKPASGISVRVL